jgi:beta-glucosidase-like glycosyl hydrolase
MCPTSFPNPNALGASFNKTAWKQMGQIIGLELRSLWLHGATEASSWSGRPHAGLDCWSPNININRDPRWGRNQEVPSEDPYLNGQFGTSYTVGLQKGKSEDPRYIQAVVTLKHWDAYSLENSGGKTRHNFNAIVDNFTLADTYLPAFKETVTVGNALGVMCSYNSVNGVPTCASPFLNKVLRDTWKFDGYVTSDTGAVADIYKEHHYTKDGATASCAALKDGGCDIDSGSVYHGNLLAGVKAGATT